MSEVRSSALAKDGGTGSLCPSPRTEEDDADPPRPGLWVLYIGYGGRWWLLGLVKTSRGRRGREERSWPRVTPSKPDFQQQSSTIQPSTTNNQLSSLNHTIINHHRPTIMHPSSTNHAINIPGVQSHNPTQLAKTSFEVTLDLTAQVSFD